MRARARSAFAAFSDRNSGGGGGATSTVARRRVRTHLRGTPRRDATTVASHAAAAVRRRIGDWCVATSAGHAARAPWDADTRIASRRTAVAAASAAMVGVRRPRRIDVAATVATVTAAGMTLAAAVSSVRASQSPARGPTPVFPCIASPK